MKTVFRLKLTPILVFAALLSSCASVRVPVPEGFAVAGRPDWKGNGSFVALTPEGIRYRVRTVENYPEKDLSFWRAALEAQLEKEGYHRIGEPMTFTASGKDGVAFEWGLPYGEGNGEFLTAIVVYPKKILIAEAGGEATLYTGYREALIASLKGIAYR